MTSIPPESGQPPINPLGANETSGWGSNWVPYDNFIQDGQSLRSESGNFCYGDKETTAYTNFSQGVAKALKDVAKDLNDNPNSLPSNFDQIVGAAAWGLKILSMSMYQNDSNAWNDKTNSLLPPALSDYINGGNYIFSNISPTPNTSVGSEIVSQLTQGDYSTSVTNWYSGMIDWMNEMGKNTDPNWSNIDNKLS